MDKLYKDNSRKCVSIPKGLSGSELAKALIEDSPYLVEGMIPTGVTVEGADPKVGKTVWAMQLSLCVASRDESKTFLTRRTAHGTVIYMDLESSPKRSLSRLIAMGADLESLDRLHIINEDIAFLGEGLEEQIEAYTHAYDDLKLIVIDTLSKVSKSTNSFMKDSQIFHSLRKIATELGITVLIVHHLSKAKHKEDPSSGLYGTQALLANADCAITLTKSDRMNNVVTLQCIGNDIESISEALEFSMMHWSVMEEGDPNTRLIERVTSSPIYYVIKRALFESDRKSIRFLPSELVEMAKDMGLDSIGEAKTVAKWLRENMTIVQNQLNVFVDERRTSEGVQFSIMKKSGLLSFPGMMTFGAGADNRMEDIPSHSEEAGSREDGPKTSVISFPGMMASREVGREDDTIPTPEEMESIEDCQNTVEVPNEEGTDPEESFLEDDMTPLAEEMKPEEGGRDAGVISFPGAMGTEED